MTDDQIRQWATDIWGANLWTDLQLQRLKRFATRAVELEREGCASMADEWARAYPHPSQAIAERIRARKPD